MKRSGWITGVLLLQLLYVLVLLAITVYLLVLVVPALVALVSWFGLWKEKRWGWWLTVVIDLGFFAAFGYSLLDDGWYNIDGALVALAAMALAQVVSLLAPKVRRLYWRGSADRLAPAAELR